MAKNYTATELVGIEVKMKIPAFNSETEQHHIGSFKMCGVVRNGNFKFDVQEPEENVEYLGPGQSTPFTKQEIYLTINGYNTFNKFLANKLKQFYIDWINVDPSS